jgi:hypothetical protein
VRLTPISIIKQKAGVDYTYSLPDKSGTVALDNDLAKTFNEVSNYESLLLLPIPIILKTVKVLNDENKGITNTIYQLWPDGTRMWIAATEDI